MKNLQLLVGNVVLPITDVAIRGSVDGTGVIWVVGVEFDNVLDAVADGQFNIPLPHKGAVSAMTMRVGEREIIADIKERGQARIEFQEAKERGQTAALFEQQRAEIFTISVGSIQPGQSIRVEVVVHDEVAVDGTEASLRIPTMIKERFVPDVPDIGIFGHQQISDSISAAKIHVNFASPVSDVVCDTSDNVVIDVSHVSADAFELTGDFVLRWSIPMEVATAKWVADTADSTMGTLEVSIRVPKTGEAPQRKKAVQIMFDRSGSMRSHYLEWARHVATQVIAQLDGDDMIHVATFDSIIEASEATQLGFARATRETKKKINAELATVTARGGTQLTQALQAMGAAFGTLDDVENSDEYERIAVLLTDGAYGDEASAAFHRENELRGVRVISVGIGENANGYLEALAANGVCVFVQSENYLHEATSKVLSRIAAPALRGVYLECDELSDVTPQFRPDVYPEVLKTVSGRIPRPISGTTVSVMSSQGLVMKIAVSESNDTSATTRWAGNFIKSLDYQMMSLVVNDADATMLEEKIVELSVTHKVLSKYTAWLAVDKETNTVREVTRTMNPPLDEESTIGLVSFNTWNTSPLVSRSMEYSWSDWHIEPRQILTTQQLDSIPHGFLDKLKETFGDSALDSSIEETQESKNRWGHRLLEMLQAFLGRIVGRFRRNQQRRRR